MCMTKGLIVQWDEDTRDKWKDVPGHRVKTCGSAFQFYIQMYNFFVPEYSLVNFIDHCLKSAFSNCFIHSNWLQLRCGAARSCFNSAALTLWPWSYEAIIQPELVSIWGTKKDTVSSRLPSIQVILKFVKGCRSYLKFMSWSKKSCLFLLRATFVSFCSTQWKASVCTRPLFIQMLVLRKWVYLRLRCQPQLNVAITEPAKFHLPCLNWAIHLLLCFHATSLKLIRDTILTEHLSQDTPPTLFSFIFHKSVIEKVGFLHCKLDLVADWKSHSNATDTKQLAWLVDCQMSASSFPRCM